MDGATDGQNVFFAVTRRERHAALATTPSGRLRVNPMVSATLGGAFVILGAIRLVEPSRGAFRLIDVSLGLAYVLLGFFYFFMFSGGRIRDAFDRRDAIESTLAITRDGLLVGLDSSARVMPWRSIRSVDDIDGYFVVRRNFGAPFVIPKRAFDDGGTRARAAFEDALVGKRLLWRPRASASIVNTAAR